MKHTQINLNVQKFFKSISTQKYFSVTVTYVNVLLSTFINNSLSSHCFYGSPFLILLTLLSGAKEQITQNFPQTLDSV